MSNEVGVARHSLQFGGIRDGSWKTWMKRPSTEKSKNKQTNKK